MNWLARLLGKSPPLSARQASALRAFQALAPCGANTSIDTQRFVVVDVETTGLNAYSDRLISIGALRVNGGHIQLAQSFEVVLRQTEPSSVDNILVHGIDGTTQTLGADPADGLLAFLAFAGSSPLVAYHASFDRIMIDRATRTFLGMTPGNPWIDLAYIAPALYPEFAANRRALDDWTSVFNIENLHRHNAVADACATAQLFLVLLARARAGGGGRLRDLYQLEKDQRWLAH